MDIDVLFHMEFWMELIAQFQTFGALGGILFAFIESFFPALPLIGIITFNVSIFGLCSGFLYSWIGTTLGSIIVFLLVRILIKKHLYPLLMKRKKLRRFMEWLHEESSITLFLLTCVPFTPSALVNIGYGLSDFEINHFIKTLCISKFIMCISLSVFGSSIKAAFHQPATLVFSCFILLLLYGVTHQIKKHLHFHTLK